MQKQIRRREGKIRSSLWVKYAIIYVLVLSVPFFVFNIFFGRYLSDQKEQEAYAYLNNELSRMTNLFDQKVEQMFSIGTQLEKVRDFRNVDKPNFDFSARIGIQQSLFSFHATSNFYHDIFYYKRDVPGVIFSTKGTYLTESYRMLYDARQEKYVSLSDADDDTLHGGWAYWQAAPDTHLMMEDVLLYVRPLTTISDGFLIFEIREKEIEQLLMNTGSSMNEVFILEGDRLLYPFSEPEEMPIIGEMGFTRWKDGRYQSSYRSSKTGLTYVYVAEMSNVGQVAQTVLSSFMILSALVGLVCFGAILFFTRFHAKPIEQLVRLAEDLAPDRTLQGVEHIRSAMYQLKDRTQELDEIRKTSMRGHVLIRLIRGKYLDETEAKENFNRLGVVFRQPYRVILLLQRETEWEESDSPALLTDQLSRQHDVFGFAYAERSVYVMMVGMADDDRSKLAAELERILEMPELAADHARVSVGGVFREFIGASESYMQALSMARREPEARVALYHQEDEDELFYPREELQALGAALSSQDRNRTVFLYDVLLKLVHKHAHYFLFSVSILSEMIDLYLQSVEKPGESYSDYLSSKQINDPESMLSCLEELHKRAIQRMTENEVSSSSAEMAGIANYISACEDMEQLNVNSVADRFGINATTLSHRFKTQMGCNISDYIITCKMDYACTLLRSTDETVAAIAEKVGYSQYSSFVRQFKHQRGLTPSAYREAWQQKNGFTS